MKYIKLLLIIIVYSLLCFQTYNKVKVNSISLSTKIGSVIQKDTHKEDIIGNIIIKKIGINQKLYKIDSTENTVDRNITILKGSDLFDEDNALTIIAAHSGTGPIAYFKDLDKLKQNDEIEIQYKDQNYTYIVKDIWNTKKTGSINVPKNNNKQLVLTTCSPNKNNYQLIINSTLKE